MPVISVADRLEAVTEPAWNRLAGDGSYYQSYNWLRYVESQQTEQARYVLAHDGTRNGAARNGEALCGALPLYRVLEAYRLLYQGEHFSELLGYTGEALVAGACRGFHAGLLLPPPGPGAPGRLATLAGLAETARQEAARDGYAGLVFPYLTTRALLDLAQVARVRAAYDITEAQMQGVSGGFGAYAEQAPRRVRSKLRSDRERFERAGWTLRERDLADCWQDAARLLDNLQRKYRHTDRTLADHERVIAGEARRLPGESVTFSCEDDGGIAGLAVFHRWRGTLAGNFAGFDYDRLRGGHEYFNVTVCAPLEYAGKNGFDRVNLGVASWEAKGYRGARLRPLWSAFLPAAPGGEPAGLELRNAGAAREQAEHITRRGIAISPAEWQLTSR